MFKNLTFPKLTYFLIPFYLFLVSCDGRLQIGTPVGGSIDEKKEKDEKDPSQIKPDIEEDIQDIGNAVCQQPKNSPIYRRSIWSTKLNCKLEGHPTIK